MITKVCSKCKKEKNIEEFVKNRRCKDGYRNPCKECNRNQQREYYHKNKEKWKKYNRVWRKNNPVKRWCMQTISAHKQNGYKVLFTTNDLLPVAKQTNTCPICDIKLDWEFGKGHKRNSPSLDRMNNSKIIKLNNIKIICYKCNSTKLDRTMKEFVDYCKMIFQKFGGN